MKKYWSYSYTNINTSEYYVTESIQGGYFFDSEMLK